MTTEHRYQIRSLTLGEILDESFILFRDSWFRLVVFQLVVFIPTAVIEVLVIRYVGQLALNFLDAGDPTEGWGSAAFIFLLGGAVAILVIQMIVAPVVGCVLTKVIADTYLSKKWGMRELVNAGKKYALQAIALGFAVALIWLLALGVPTIVGGLLAYVGITSGGVSGVLTLVLFGLIALSFGIPALLAGVYVNLRFTLAFCVMVLEDKGVVDSMTRSARLMSGKYWEAFSLWFVMFLISILLGLVATLFVPSPSFEMLQSAKLRELVPQLVSSQSISTILSEFMGMFSRTFIIICWTLYYFSTRCRREAFDLVLLSKTFSKRS